MWTTFCDVYEDSINATMLELCDNNDKTNNNDKN